MIKIMGLSFVKSAELERVLNNFNIPYNWDYNEGYLGCIDKLYDIEITGPYITIAYSENLLEVKIWRFSEKSNVFITAEDKMEKIIIHKDEFKELILS